MIFASIVEPLDRDPDWLRYRIELRSLAMCAAVQSFALATEPLRAALEEFGASLRRAVAAFSTALATVEPYLEETR